MSPSVALPKQESVWMSWLMRTPVVWADMLMAECHAEFALPLAIELASMV